MSMSSRLIERLLLLSGAAKDLSPRRFYRKLRRNAIRYKRGERRRLLLCGVRAEKSVYCGMPYYVFIPKEVETNKSVLYIHGSAYMNEPRAAQIFFAAEIARKTHAKVYFPIYPKLPLSSVLPCFALLNNFFVFLRKIGRVLLIGDSSGGALALSLAATREEIGEVIAISPWVSLSLSEEARAISTDVMLSSELLDRVGALWAKDLPYEDVRLSPIQGKFKGKSLFLIYGERERFRPDILRFCKEQSDRGATVTCMEGKGGQHCYPLMPTPEGKSARKEIIHRLQRSLYGEER